MNTGDFTGVTIESSTGTADSGANLIGFLQEKESKRIAVNKKK
jgi:hypothetical protein